MTRAIGIFLVTLVCAGCGGSSGGSVSPSAPTAIPPPTVAAGERYVTVAFWNDSTCSGEPANMNRFPVHYGDTQCYTWPWALRRELSEPVLLRHRQLQLHAVDDAHV